MRCFNEAGAFEPRKWTLARCTKTMKIKLASMRPGRLSPGNEHKLHKRRWLFYKASMRPGRLSPGNAAQAFR